MLSFKWMIVCVLQRCVCVCVYINKVCVRPVDTLRFNLITAGVMKRKRGGSGNRRSEQDGKDRLRRRGKGWREGGGVQSGNGAMKTPTHLPTNTQTTQRRWLRGKHMKEAER